MTTRKSQADHNDFVRYVAFLRGINVGGSKPIKMADLQKAFESIGFRNVKTVLASGNVLFSAPNNPQSTLVQQIEEKLKMTFGHDVGVIVRTVAEIRQMADSNPFKNVSVTPQTRLYVTFLSVKPKTTAKPSVEEDFGIVRVTDTEVCSFVVLSPGLGTTELMGVLEKQFGKKVTTRNWNTITKILEAGQE
jgi:uncharacterized protein (DUF1697 family)